MTMTTRDNRGGHLTGGLEVVKTDGNIETRRLAVHQFHHRNPGDFDHFKVRGVWVRSVRIRPSIFRESIDSVRSCSISGL